MQHFADHGMHQIQVQQAHAELQHGGEGGRRAWEEARGEGFPGVFGSSAGPGHGAGQPGPSGLRTETLGGDRGSGRAAVGRGGQPLQ